MLDYLRTIDAEGGIIKYRWSDANIRFLVSAVPPQSDPPRPAGCDAFPSGRGLRALSQPHSRRRSCKCGLSHIGTKTSSTFRSRRNGRRRGPPRGERSFDP